MTVDVSHLIRPSLAAMCLALSSGAASAQESCTAATVGDAPFECLCPEGFPEGTVWGSGPYTADSAICAAALHAGAIGKTGGVVRVVPGPGLDAFPASAANGIETREWGPYGTSFSFQTGVSATASLLPACSAYPVGEVRYSCACGPDDFAGAVWGTGIYTADSSICAAARHAGAIGPQGGDVHVMGMAGLVAYRGSEANGVSTRPWGTYDNSFVIDLNQ